MAELPVLPIATDALIADTTHMSAEAFGAYVRILVAMWRQGGALDDDDTELARIAGVSSRRWLALREVVLRPVTVTDGVLTQRRLSETWNDVQRIRVKRVAASQERWRRRFVSPQPRNAHASAPPHASASPNADAHASPNGHAPGMQVQSTCNAIPKPKVNITTTLQDTARVREPVENQQISPTDDLATVIEKRGWKTAP